MDIELISYAILAIVAGLGLLAGYWGRIAKKLEDKRDEIHLTTLPKIYADTIAFQDVLTLFEKGEKLSYLEKSLGSAIDELSKTIYSSNILIFKTELHDSLMIFHKELKNFQAVVREIQGNKDKDNTVKKEQADALRSALKSEKDFPIGHNLRTNPKEVFIQADNIRKDVKKELDRYRSYSWKLMILIFGLGMFIGLVELIKTLLTP